MSIYSCPDHELIVSLLKAHFNTFGALQICIVILKLITGVTHMGDKQEKTKVKSSALLLETLKIKKSTFTGKRKKPPQCQN